MKNLYLATKSFRELVILAEDEQRRAGHPEIDVEHLFLALLGVGGAVTNTLNSRGITLASAREAFASAHRQRIASLGLTPPTNSAPAGIPPAAPGRPWHFREGVRDMLLAAHNSPQPDVSLLHALVAERTGLVTSVLNSFRVDPESLTFAGAGTDTTNTRSQEYGRFVPATPDEVWSLLSDPDRWLEWNSVEFERCERADFGVIRAYPRSDSRHRTLVSELIVRRYTPTSAIEWERIFPDVEGAAIQLFMVTLEPSGPGGTELTLSTSFLAGSGRQLGITSSLAAPLRRLLRPLTVRSFLRSKADNISQALRS